jgi:hypothetical protein
MGFLSSFFDPAGVFGGSSDNSLGDILDPIGSALGIHDNLTPDFLLDLEHQGTDFLQDVGDFEKFNLQEMLKKVRKNPEQLLLGAADPLGADMWSNITGKEYDPIVDQWGGASKDTYRNAARRGINVGPGATMHGIARSIAGSYAGGAAADGLGFSNPMGLTDYMGNAAIRGGISAGQGGNFGRSFAQNMIPYFGQATGIGDAMSSGLDDLYRRGMSMFGNQAGGQEVNPSFNLNLGDNDFSASVEGAGAPITDADTYSPLNTGMSMNYSIPDYNSPNIPANVSQKQGNEGYDYSLGTEVPNVSFGTEQTNLPSFASPEDAGFAEQFNRFRGSPAYRLFQQAIAAKNPRLAQAMGGLGLGATGKPSGIEQGLGALGSLYMGMRQDKDLRNQAGQLQSLFSGTSPYAQMMRQRLERKDAAAGRRSQAGTREVELAARLAELNSRNAPMLNQLTNARNVNQANTLRSMLQYLNQAGGPQGIYQGLNQWFQGLNNG